MRFLSELQEAIQQGEAARIRDTRYYICRDGQVYHAYKLPIDVMPLPSLVPVHMRYCATHRSFSFTMRNSITNKAEELYVLDLLVQYFPTLSRSECQYIAENLKQTGSVDKIEYANKGYIYLITDNTNGFHYVGQTIRDPRVRFQCHVRDARLANENAHSYALHKAMKAHGIENFSCEILASDVPVYELDEIEKQKIIEYDSVVWHKHGYNMTIGGKSASVFGHCSLTPEDAEVLRNVIACNPEYSLTEIANMVDLPANVLWSLNRGETYYSEACDYPIRKVHRHYLAADKHCVDGIMLDLSQTDLTISDIAQKYNVNRSIVSLINQGKYPLLLDDPSYDYLDFPVRLSRVNKTKSLLNIIWDIVTTQKTLAVLASEYQKTEDFLIRLSAGTCHRVSGLFYPLRRYQEENKTLLLLFKSDILRPRYFTEPVKPELQFLIEQESSKILEGKITTREDLQAALHSGFVSEIEGYGGYYFVSRDGLLYVCRKNGPKGKNLSTESVLPVEMSPKIQRNGSYARAVIGLRNEDGKRVYKTVANIVAEAFVPNPFGYKYIKHLNGDLLDNSASNLEWSQNRTSSKQSSKGVSK